MLTILNIINYLIGKPLSMYVLILATLVIYYCILSNLWENNFYFIVTLILLLLDVTIIFIMFSVCHNYDLNKCKKYKHKPNKKINKKNIVSTEIVNVEQPIIHEKEINISLYNPDAEVSLKTYN
jgi:predicted membrane protein